MSFVPSTRTSKNAVFARRRAIAAVSLCVVVSLALSACASSSTAGSGGLSNVTASASASAAATPPTTPPATPTAAPATAAATSHPYPSDYAGAILGAWKAHDTAYLTLLTSAATASQIYAFGNINQVWTGLAGSGAAGSTYWQYYNNAGDWLVLRTGNVATGAHKWHAGEVSTWDQMTFPSDPDAYVKRFVDGWLNGNVARMKLLSSAAITAQFMAISNKPDFSYTVGANPGGGAAGSQYIDVLETDPAFSVTIQVTSQFLGQQHAIAGCQSGC